MNFTTWQTNILTDALMIDAQDVSAQVILLEGQHVVFPSYTTLRVKYGLLSIVLYMPIFGSH